MRKSLMRRKRRSCAWPRRRPTPHGYHYSPPPLQPSALTTRPQEIDGCVSLVVAVSSHEEDAEEFDAAKEEELCQAAAQTDTTRVPSSSSVLLSSLELSDTKVYEP